METPVNIEELRRGGITKLKEKDMFGLWVKTSCCNLNSTQLEKLADITDIFGRGFLLFTTRQIPIIPWININDVPDVKAELGKVEMELDRCGNRVRNINVCYDSNICPEAVLNCISLGERLESYYRNPILYKIKIGIAGCGRDCIISRVLNDVSFVAAERDGRKGYDVHIGGRLGVKPSVGQIIAELLDEDESIRFVQNYFELLQQEGKAPSERGADVIKRMGLDAVRERLTRNLRVRQETRPVACQSNARQPAAGKLVLRIRATCGEVNSKQLRQIADIARRYGPGFVHFAVRGAPEIPCVDETDLPRIREALREVGLRPLDDGIDNLQACFGWYCSEAVANPQSLLRQVEARAARMGLDNRNVTVSGSGCPNSCGIAHLSDIGFHGVVDPEVDTAICSGCELCVSVCKRRAITMQDGVAVIDKEECRYCGACLGACPLDAITEKRKGFALLVGGRGGPETRLGVVIARFLAESEAVELAETCLSIIKERNASLADIISESGEGDFKGMLLARNSNIIRSFVAP